MACCSSSSTCVVPIGRPYFRVPWGLVVIRLLLRLLSHHNKVPADAVWRAASAIVNKVAHSSSSSIGIVTGFSVKVGIYHLESRPYVANIVVVVDALSVYRHEH